MNEAQKNFLVNLRNQIARHKLDIATVAMRIGVSASGFYKITSGAVEPSMHHLDKLSRLFGCSPADLFGEPTAQKMPTIHEALRVIEREVEWVSGLPDLKRVPPDILALLATAGEPEFEAIRKAINKIS